MPNTIKKVQKRARPAISVPTFYDLKSTALVLGVCSKTVRRLITKGALPATRIGRGLRISDLDVRAYLTANRVRPGFVPLRPE